MKTFFARLLLLAILAGIGRAAPAAQNLGQGLTYFRVHQLASDLPSAEEARRGPCVLDLRYVSGNADEATALASWLKSRATARTPVFVLANASTSAAIITVITPRGAGASVIVFGAATGDFAPDIAVKVSADAERRAYDAVEHGASPGSVISENSLKPRNDEAKLARERVPEALAPTDDPANPSSAGPAEDSAKQKSPPPVIDPVLQRAVQTHRALVALKKL
jgi:hypothetical protein